MSIRVRKQRYISSLLLEVIRLDGARVGAGVTVAIDNIDKLGAKPGLLGMGRLTVSVAYVSRERYVCLTGKNLAGWVSRHKTLLFLPPALRIDSDFRLARSTFTKPDFKMIGSIHKTTTQWLI